MQSRSPRPAILAMAALLLVLPIEALAQRHGGGGHGGWRGGGGGGHNGWRGGGGYGRHGYGGGYGGYRGYRGYRGGHYGYRGYGGYYGGYGGYYGYPAYGYGYGYPGYYGGYYGYGDGWAAAFGAGIIGLILGTAIASHDHDHHVAAPPYGQVAPPVETYRCADGTVIPTDGQCPVALVPVDPSQFAPDEPAEAMPSG